MQLLTWSDKLQHPEWKVDQLRSGDNTLQSDTNFRKHLDSLLMYTVKVHMQWRKDPEHWFLTQKSFYSTSYPS